jgi:outer membrane protein assembly factor BamB
MQEISIKDMCESTKRVTILILIFLLLSGCSQVDGLFDRTKESGLQGTRIPVLTRNKTPRIDTELSSLEVLIPEPIINDSWSQQGGKPNHVLHHLALGDASRLVWSKKVGARSTKNAPILSGPVISNEIIYTMDSDATVSAHSTKNGVLLWRNEIAPEKENNGNWGGGLAVNEGFVYVATGFAEVLALAGDTGKEIWRTGVSGPMRAAPTVFNGRVFVITKDNQLFALSTKEGKSLWSHTGFEEMAGLIGSASPAVDGNIVIVPYSSGEIYALRAENGRQLWDENLTAIRRADAVSALADIRGRPVINQGRVYAISHSGRMVAIDLTTGRRVWETPLGGVNQPWVSGDFIFVLTSDAKVVCLTAVDGRIKWIKPIGLFEKPKDKKGRISWSGPILAGGRLILSGSHGKVLYLSPYTGKTVLVKEMPSAVSRSPIVVNKTLFFFTDKARLFAFR